MKMRILAVTNDFHFEKNLKNVIEGKDCIVLFERYDIGLILKIIEENVRFIMIDINKNIQEVLEITRIIHSTKPKTPIIVFSDIFDIERIRKLTQAGIFYCAMKPVQAEEMNSVFEAINRFYKNREEFQPYTPRYKEAQNNY